MILESILTGAVVVLCVLMPMVLYALVRIVQAINVMQQDYVRAWQIQNQTNKLLADSIAEYMPQGVTLQQIKSELTDHLQQHAARDMRQAGSLNTTEYPNLRGPVSPSGKWADLQLETEAIDGDQIV